MAKARKTVTRSTENLNRKVSTVHSRRSKRLDDIVAGRYEKHIDLGGHPNRLGVLGST
jgi:hypothetical protein